MSSEQSDASASESQDLHLKAWRDTARRVSVLPTWPIPIVDVDVHPLSHGMLELSCIIETIDVDNSPADPSEDKPWTEYPRTNVKHATPVNATATEDVRLFQILQLIRHAIEHEIDEILLVDGKPARNPHPGLPQITRICKPVNPER